MKLRGSEPWVNLLNKHETLGPGFDPQKHMYTHTHRDDNS